MNAVTVTGSGCQTVGSALSASITQLRTAALPVSLDENADEARVPLHIERNGRISLK